MLLIPPSAKNIVFIIDANNEVERQYLSEWIDLSVVEQNIVEQRIFLPISSDPEAIPVIGLTHISSSSGDTLIIPVRVVWSRPKKQLNKPRRLRELIRTKGVIPDEARAARILRQEPERALKIAAESATVAELKERFSNINGALDNTDRFTEFVAEQAALALDVAERRHTGGRYKVPRRVAENIKSSQEFKSALQALSESTERPMDDLLEETDSIMKEMIATPTPFWVDLGSTIAKKLTSLAYDSEIVLNPADVARTKEIVTKYPTAFLWTHKTHVDGMAMQKVLYENEFPPAHTFGGINIAFAGMGHASRRSGVIFIRRSFQDNPLYKMILQHYIGYLLKKRFPFSWAFEGTRSRVGKLMPPRYGLLKYLIEAANTTKTENLHIIPVAINYDMIGDASDFAKEQLGETKRAESLSWFIGYVRGLRQPMGRIYMDFGKPVVLENAPSADDKLAISKIAFQVGVEVNQVTPITLTSIVTMVLLAAYPRALTANELSHEIIAILEWARERGIRTSSDLDIENKDHSEELAEILVNTGVITRYDEGESQFFSISPEQHVLASYYRNTIAHYFVYKSIAEIALLVFSTKKGATIDAFWAEAEKYRDLFKFEFFYASSEEFRRELAAELNNADPHWEEGLLGNNANADLILRQLKPLVAHATLIQFAEAYWVASTVLVGWQEAKVVDEKQFINKCLGYGRQAYLQRRVRTKASIGKELFVSAYKLFANMELLEPDPKVTARRKSTQTELRNLINRIERIRSRALPI